MRPEFRRHLRSGDPHRTRARSCRCAARSASGERRTPRRRPRIVVCGIGANPPLAKPRARNRRSARCLRPRVASTDVRSKAKNDSERWNAATGSAPILEEIALADFDESAVRRADGEALVLERARQRIQHHVDAAAARSRRSTSSAKSSVRESMTCATPSERSSSRFSSLPAVATRSPRRSVARVAPRRAPRHRPRRGSGWSRRVAAAPDCTARDRPCRRRPESMRLPRGRGAPGPSTPHPRCRTGARRMRRPSVQSPSRDRRPASVRTPRADANDAAAEFVAERRRFVRPQRIDAERLHHVAEIQPGGGDLDFHLARDRRTTAHGRGTAANPSRPDCPICSAYAGGRAVAGALAGWNWRSRRT